MTDWEKELRQSEIIKSKGTKSKGGFFMVPNSLVDSILTKLSGNQVKVLMVLLRHANTNKECWPGHQLIQRKTRCSASTVKRSINELCKLGIIRKETTKVGNIYTLSPLNKNSYPIQTLQGGCVCNN